MKRKKNPYSETLTSMLTKAEFEEVQKKKANSTCRSMSAYVRKAVTEMPVTFYYRNKSFDEFVAEWILLRKEMRLIREAASFSEADKKRLIILQEEINQKITQFIIQCLPK